MRCPLLPTSDRILFIPDKPKVGLIHITNPRVPKRGVVVAVGPDCAEVAVGDVIVHGKMDTIVVEVDGEAWSLVSEREVLCKTEVA